MESWRKALEAYQHLDPTGWVAVYRLMPWWAALLGLLLGVLLMLFGGGRLFRIVAGPLGGAAGWLWGPVLAAKFGLEVPSSQLGIVAGVALCLLGFAVPSAAVFFIFGLPSGLIAGELVGKSDWLLGFAPAFVLCGAAAVALNRFIGAVASSLAGAWLWSLGLLTLLHGISSSAADAIGAQAWGVLAAGAFFAVGGTLFQILVRGSSEERSELRMQRAEAKRRRHEEKVLEKRWASYSNKRGLP